MEALPGAQPNARTALFCAAALAERLAHELRDEAIVADAEGDWHAYADALENVVRTADSTRSPQEILWAISASIAKIIPVRGHPAP
jgi:hypothetical protein